MSNKWNPETLAELLRKYDAMAGNYQTKIGRLAREFKSNRAEVGMMLAKARDHDANVLAVVEEDGKLVRKCRTAYAWGSN